MYFVSMPRCWQQELQHSLCEERLGLPCAGCSQFYNRTTAGLLLSLSATMMALVGKCFYERVKKRCTAARRERSEEKNVRNNPADIKVREEGDGGMKLDLGRKGGGEGCFLFWFCLCFSLSKSILIGNILN